MDGGGLSIVHGVYLGARDGGKCAEGAVERGGILLDRNAVDRGVVVGIEVDEGSTE